jgi:hypothetical protein
MHKQALQHGLNVLRLAETALDLRAAASGASDDEIAGADIADPLAVEDERDPGNEVRLAHDELAALRNLDDDAVGR